MIHTNEAADLPRAMSQLNGKNIIITGAGGGLGRAYAIAAAASGAAVLVNDINLDSAQSVCEEIGSSGGRAVASGASVADWEGAQEIVEECRRRLGRVDGLVNNAGINSWRTPQDEDERSIRSVVEVNLIGSMFVGAHVVKAMLTDGLGGSIVNITSSAQMGIRGLGTYGATKGALASLTYAWALDLASSGIRVNAYSPLAHTPMDAAGPVLVPRDQLPTPADNAALVCYLLSDLSTGITGQVVKREGSELIVMCHPGYTDARVTAVAWDIESIMSAFDPVLRRGVQPVGAPDR